MIYIYVIYLNKFFAIFSKYIKIAKNNTKILII
jgi:hypothetical protein